MTGTLGRDIAAWSVKRNVKAYVPYQKANQLKSTEVIAYKN